MQEQTAQLTEHEIRLRAMLEAARVQRSQLSDNLLEFAGELAVLRERVQTLEAEKQQTMDKLSAMDAKDDLP